MSFQCGHRVGCPSLFAQLGTDSGLHLWRTMGTVTEHSLAVCTGSFNVQDSTGRCDKPHYSDGETEAQRGEGSRPGLNT